MSKSEQLYATALAAALIAGGCAGQTTPEQGPTGSAPAQGGEATEEAEPEASATDAAASAEQSAESAEASSLPEAPWSAEPLATSEAPPTLLTAWKRAENRDFCAPVAPRGFGAGEGATSRRGELYGGWSVEFDKPGAPGLRADGTPCDGCGRATFGIAGTGMAPDELTDAETGAEPPASFEDGSHAEITSAEGVAAATITVAGQDCVYQVWSHLGEDHVRHLVDSLRIVAVGEPVSGPDRVADLSF